MADTEKPCECRWDTSQSDMIEYCPLHATAPDGLKLAKAVRGSTTITPRIRLLARQIIEAAEPKER